MSNRRYALSAEDIRLILAALEYLHRSSSVNPGVYSEYELASRQRVNQIRRLFGNDDVKLEKEEKS